MFLLSKAAEKQQEMCCRKEVGAGAEGVEGGKGTRGKELDIQTRLAATALENHAVLGMRPRRVGDSLPADASEQIEDVLHR